VNVDPATMAALKALSASTAATHRALLELGDWGDEIRRETQERLGLPVVPVLDTVEQVGRLLGDPAYDAALGFVHRATLIAELCASLLRDFTTSSISEGPEDPDPPAGAAAPALVPPALPSSSAPAGR
jgi:hypothetical protein